MPKVIPRETLAAAVELARERSLNAAAAEYGLAPRTISLEMRRLGIPRRRTGAFTTAEVLAMAWKPSRAL